MTEVLHTCYTLKMARFIEFYVDEKPKPVNWDDLYNEYTSLRENKQSLFVLNMMKEIAFLKAKFFIISKCIEVLALAPVPELIQELKSYGFRAQYNWDNKSTYSRDLRRAETGAKRFKIMWEQKEKELQAHIAKYEQNKDTKKEFYMWAITLEDHRKVRVDLEQITVAEWCLMLNQYEKYCEVKHAEKHNVMKYGKRG